MKITFINPETEKTKKVKLGFNWVIFGFAEIYAIPFFVYRLYFFGIIFLLTCLACGYFGAPYYNAFVENPYIITDLDKILPFYTPPLVISAIINIILLVLGGIYGNRLIAKKYIKNGWKIAETNPEIIGNVIKKWKLSESDFINQNKS